MYKYRISINYKHSERQDENEKQQCRLAGDRRGATAKLPKGWMQGWRECRGKAEGMQG